MPREQDLFAFGHGLSYTTFDHGPATLDRVADDPLTIEVAAPVRNTGDRAGHDVVQVYVEPLRPRRQHLAKVRVAHQAGRPGQRESSLIKRVHPVLGGR